MSVAIHPVKLGFDCCYLLHADNGAVVFIDGGESGHEAEFTAMLEQLRIEPSRIGLVVLTHCHWDHIGCLQKIRDVTGAKIAVHRAEKDWAESGRKVNPPGITIWGKVVSTLVGGYLPFVRISPCEVDLVVEDTGFSLNEYGVPGQVLHTPGHSPGSLTVVLPTGEAFVGDMAMSRLPLRLSPGLPIFAHDASLLRESWERVLAAGATTIYPAHGPPFSAEAIRQALES